MGVIVLGGSFPGVIAQGVNVLEPVKSLFE